MKDNERAKIMQFVDRLRDLADDVNAAQNEDDCYGCYLQLMDIADDMETFADDDKVHGTN